MSASHSGLRGRAASLRADLSAAALFALFSPVIVGCPNEELAVLAPCTQSVGRASITEVGTDQVDLLFVIDDSGSMEEEQTSLAQELPELVEALTSGKLEPDAAPTFRPVKLHVGVVSTDLGAPLSDERYRCNASKDGRLIGPPPTATADTLSPYLAFEPGVAVDRAKVERAVKLGILGCGIEQQLEASLKALSPSEGSVDFAEGSGHGDGENAGFLRKDSLVVVVLVTDEDDCSAPALGSFIQAGDNELELACATTDQLYPTSRYVDGLKALRKGRENMVLFAAITGVPRDLVADPEAVDYDAILEDPRMQNRSDGAERQPKLVESCSEPAVGVARPPRRIVEVAKAFGENGIVQSICKDDYSGALAVVTRRITELLGTACPPRKLLRDGAGLVECRLVETPAADERCDDLPGRSALTEGDAGQCAITQVAVTDDRPDEGAGWYYDALDEDGRCKGDTGAIRFTSGGDPRAGSRIDLECLSTVASQEPNPRNEDAQGLACTSDASCQQRVDGTRTDLMLFCDEQTRRCQIACASDAACKAPMLCDVTGEPPRCVASTCLDDAAP